MNHNYYDNPIYSENNFENYRVPIDNNQLRNNSYNTDLFIDMVISKNRGKKAKIYITIPGSGSLQDKVFDGIIENGAKDHIIISNPNNGEWSIIPMIYLDYINFEEPIIY